MKTLASIAVEVSGTLSEPAYGEVLISRVSAFSNAGPDALVFIEHVESLEAAVHARAGAILAPLTVGVQDHGIPILRVGNPRLAFARAATFLKGAQVAGIIHNTAVIERSAMFGVDVSVGPHAVIGDAKVGDGTAIGAGCFIASGVVIGSHCVLHPHVTVYAGTTLGDHVIVHAGAVLGADGFGYVRDPESGEYLQFPQQGTLMIEDRVEIGANTTIDRGALEETRIGKGTKLDNLVHVGHNCRIGSNVVIASQTGISGSCVIGDGAILGGQVGMGDHVTIGEDVILGGGAGILPHKNLRGPHQIFWGTPAKPLKRYLKELATLSKLSRPASDKGKGE